MQLWLTTMNEKKGRCFMIWSPAVFLILAMLSSGTVLGSDVLDQTSRESRHETNGVELVCVVSQGEFAGGEPVYVSLAVTNKGRDTVTYGTERSIGDYEILLKDDKGNMVPLTRYGRLHMRFGTDRFRRTAYRMEKLRPGDKISALANLARLFDLTLAGKYSLTVKRLINEGSSDVRKPFELVTSPLEIEISEPAPLASPKSPAEQPLK